MSIREEFEAWALTTGFESHHFTRDADGKYTDYDVRRLWIPWQASRAALVVKLPSFREITMGRRENEHDSGFNAAVDLCIDAVEAAGLKVRP